MNMTSLSIRALPCKISGEQQVHASEDDDKGSGAGHGMQQILQILEPPLQVAPVFVHALDMLTWPKQPAFTGVQYAEPAESDLASCNKVHCISCVGQPGCIKIEHAGNGQGSVAATDINLSTCRVQ